MSKPSFRSVKMRQRVASRQVEGKCLGLGAGEPRRSSLRFNNQRSFFCTHKHAGVGPKPAGTHTSDGARTGGRRGRCSRGGTTSTTNSSTQADAKARQSTRATHHHAVRTYKQLKVHQLILPHATGTSTTTTNAAHQVRPLTLWRHAMNRNRRTT